MNRIDFNATTLSYYEAWIGKEGCLSDNDYIQFVYSDERNKRQTGYSSCSDLYIWIQPDKFIISYGDAAKGKIQNLKERFSGEPDISTAKQIISEIYGCNVNHNIKYVLLNPSQSLKPEAKTLKKDDYDDYEAFFLRCFPDNNVDWLKEYFNDMVHNNYCVGMYVDGIIVSCTDAPSMPYMANRVQEIGINTICEYRGKGYAAAVCEKAIYNILVNGKVPQWLTTVVNIASQKLAERISFVKLADVLTISLAH